MKAVVLAAGEGRRLEPLTEVRPKPMLPIANKPLLEHVVEAVVDAGIEELVLVVGYKRERIQSYFEDGDDWGIDIEYVVQDKQLGTGHAILQAEPAVGGPFLVLNGDRILEPSIVERMIEATPSDEALLAVTRSGQPSDYGVVDVEGDRVVAITEKPPQHATTSDIINAGVYRFDQDLFDAIRRTETEGELTVTAALNGLAADERVQAIRYDGLWLDVSYLWDLVEVNAIALDRFGGDVAETATVHDASVLGSDVAIDDDTTVEPNATLLSGTSMSENVRVGANVVLSNTIVLSDAIIHAGAVLRDCVVGENTTVGPNTTVAGGPADVAVGDTLHSDVGLGAVIGDNAMLEGGVTIAPGTTIGTGALVESGCVLDGHVPSDAEVRRG